MFFLFIQLFSILRRTHVGTDNVAITSYSNQVELELIDSEEMTTSVDVRDHRSKK